MPLLDREALDELRRLRGPRMVPAEMRRSRAWMQRARTRAGREALVSKGDTGCPSSSEERGRERMLHGPQHRLLDVEIARVLREMGGDRRGARRCGPVERDGARRRPCE